MDGHLAPSSLVSVACGELFPCGDVGVEVLENEVVVVVHHELVADALEVARETREGAVGEHVDDAAQTVAATHIAATVVYLLFTSFMSLLVLHWT